jgi:hypothetical protein
MAGLEHTQLVSSSILLLCFYAFYAFKRKFTSSCMSSTALAFSSLSSMIFRFYLSFLEAAVILVTQE